MQLLGGKPLIGHSIEQAFGNDYIDQTFVSTDNSEIADYAQDFGVECILRPEELSSDTAPEWKAWQHAISYVINKYGEFDRFISLPATAPLRTQQNIDDALEALSSSVDIVITASEARRHPNFNLITCDSANMAHLFSPPKTPISRRQDAPPAFDMTTVAYVSRPNFILNNNRIWDGNVAMILVDELSAVDIDTPLDLQYARFLYAQKSENIDGKE